MFHLEERNFHLWSFEELESSDRTALCFTMKVVSGLGRKSSASFRPR